MDDPDDEASEDEVSEEEVPEEDANDLKNQVSTHAFRPARCFWRLVAPRDGA